MRTDMVHSILSQSLPDLKAEVILAELLDMGGLSLDNIAGHPSGLFERSYAPDLDRSKSKEGADDIFDFFLNRAGLYDGLPEALVHRPGSSDPFKETDVMIRESRQFRAEEKEARQFFSPIDQELFRKSIELEIEERRALIDTSGTHTNESLEQFWGVSPLLDPRQKVLLFFLLPFAHRICGNRPLTEQCLTAILGIPAKITVRTKPAVVPAERVPLLGQARLGVNAVLGSSFIDSVPGVTLTLGPVPRRHLMQFIAGGRSEKIVNHLLDWFFPISWDTQVQLDLLPEEQDFILDPDPAQARLGYTTSLVS